MWHRNSLDSLRANKWSKKYERCVNCGQSGSPHASKGTCQKCYGRLYRQTHQRVVSKRTQWNKSKFTFQFSDTICTLKKFIPVLILRLYSEENLPPWKKAIKAKRYIKSTLCQTCRHKYVNEWTNDLIPANQILCSSCNAQLRFRITNSLQNKQLPWVIKLMKHLKRKRQAIQYEMEFRLGRPFKSVLRNWYITHKMSAIEIQAKLLTEYGLSISARDLTRWLAELGLIRTHVQAMRNRVVTGRMKYYRRHQRKQGTSHGGNGTLQRTKMLSFKVPGVLKRRIRALARRKRQTMSEVVRDVIDIFSATGQPAPPIKWQKLQYVLDNHRDLLLSKRRKRAKGPHVVLHV